MARKIELIIPDPGPDAPKPGDNPPGVLLIDPEGATPGREVPGFFVLAIDGVHVLSDKKPDGDAPRLPRQFLSLRAVQDYLDNHYGTGNPLRVRQWLAIERGGPTDFPAIWVGTRGKGKDRKSVTVRYLGSFRYWDGRRVDPTKVGTTEEFH